MSREGTGRIPYDRALPHEAAPLVIHATQAPTMPESADHESGC